MIDVYSPYAATMIVTFGVLQRPHYRPHAQDDLAREFYRHNAYDPYYCTMHRLALCGADVIDNAVKPDATAFLFASARGDIRDNAYYGMMYEGASRQSEIDDSIDYWDKQDCEYSEGMIYDLTREKQFITDIFAEPRAMDGETFGALVDAAEKADEYLLRRHQKLLLPPA